MDISVVIPTYNRAALIERAVKSVLDQSFKPLEVIVVDDGSTDNTAEIVKQINDPLVKYVYKENGGAGSARNCGVKNSLGDWIAFHDSDDVWRPHKLEIQKDYAIGHQEFDLIYSAYEIHFADGTSRKIPDENNIEYLQGDILVPLLIRNTIGTPTMLVRKESFLKTGGFDERLRCIEDWNFAIRFAENQLIGYLDNVVMDVYRVDDGVSSNVAEMFEERCRTILKYRNLLERYKLFDTAIKLMFDQATNLNCLEQVKKMFMTFLAGTI